MTYFPSERFNSARDYAAAYFAQYQTAAASIDPASLHAAGELLADVVASGGTIFACGNGGSAAIANHLACDYLKGIRNGTGLRPRVFSLSTNIELMTAIANDIGYEDVFAYQLESLGRPGDLLIAISSSGQSPNIIRALTEAGKIGLRTLSMTGFDGGEAARLADVNLHVQAQNYGVAEDVHQSIMHVLTQYVRHRALSDPMSLGHVKF